VNLHRMAVAETVLDNTGRGSAPRPGEMRQSFAFPREVTGPPDQSVVPHEEVTRSGASWPWWRLALTGLSALALALSAYLSWHSVVGGSVIGCGGGSRCNKVLSSRWSFIGGVLPVSGLAAGAYLAMLVASLSIGPASAAPVRRLAWRTMLVLVGAAAGSAVWFMVVQKWLIRAFCPYCMTTHICGLLLSALIIWRARMQLEEPTIVVPASSGVEGCVRSALTVKGVSRAMPRSATGSWPAIRFLLAGIGLAGVLATCQAVFAPPVLYVRGESRNKPPAPDPHSVPLLGSPEAPYIVSLLFDYKCPHCQQLHFLLNETIRRYNGKLAFALCPTPLNRQCNAHVPQDVEEFKDSCELAKVGLAVWVAEREAFTAFDHWMFSFESGDRWTPRSLDAAKAKAIELVGQAKFDAGWNDPWVPRYMQTSVRIYGDTGSNAIPKFVFGPRWVTPEAREANDVVFILHNSLAVPNP
jgi:uncharacterized membrane protein